MSTEKLNRPEAKLRTLTGSPSFKRLEILSPKESRSLNSKGFIFPFLTTTIPLEVTYVKYSED